MELLNNGHTAQVSFTQSPMPSITGGGLTDTYEFLQFHFHWGSDDTKGSEHLIDGKAYPLEVHLVHWNKKYADVGEALGQSDGLAVLGFMFNVSDSDNSAYAPIITALPNVKDAAATAPVTPVAKLEDFLGTGLTDFYRYQGSLTTPTCNEAVTWTVFKEAIGISATQLAEFRKTLDSHKDPIVNNFRPPQPLNGRTVYTS